MADDQKWLEEVRRAAGPAIYYRDGDVINTPHWATTHVLVSNLHSAGMLASPAVRRLVEALEKYRDAAELVAPFYKVYLSEDGPAQEEVYKAMAAVLAEPEAARPKPKVAAIKLVGGNLFYLTEEQARAVEAAVPEARAFMKRAK